MMAKINFEYDWRKMNRWNPDSLSGESMIEFPDEIKQDILKIETRIKEKYEKSC